MDTRAEKIKERNKIAKQESRQRQKIVGVIVDAPDKRRRVINNICAGKLVRSDINKLGITLDMIPCPHDQIHPEIYKRLTTPCEIPAEPKKFKIHIKSTKLKISLRKFTDQSIEAVYDELSKQNQLSPATINVYRNNINLIRRVLNCTDEDFVKCVNDPKVVIDTLTKIYPDSYKDKLSPIISLSKYSTLFKSLVSSQVIDVYKKAQAKGIKLSIKKQSHIANTGIAIPWENIINIRVKFNREEPFSQKHLLASLYTYIPTIRDNFGAIHILKTNIDATASYNDTENFYLVTSGRLIINYYKTKKKYGTLDIILPRQLRCIIDGSLKRNNRDWLITQNENMTNKLYTTQTKSGLIRNPLSDRISNIFNFGIDELRHSFVTYYIKNMHLFTYDEIILIQWIMGHSASTALQYLRTGDMDPIKVPMGLYEPSPFNKPTETNILQSICDKIGGNIE
jgi:hypothetical protein